MICSHSSHRSQSNISGSILPPTTCSIHGMRGSEKDILRWPSQQQQKTKSLNFLFRSVFIGMSLFVYLSLFLIFMINPSLTFLPLNPLNVQKSREQLLHSVGIQTRGRTMICAERSTGDRLLLKEAVNGPYSEHNVIRACCRRGQHHCEVDLKMSLNLQSRFFNSCGQSYKQFMLVNYDSRVVLNWNLFMLRLQSRNLRA